MFVSFFFNLYGSDGLLVVRGAPSSQLQFSLCVCSVPQSCPTVCHPLDCARQAPLFMGFPRQEYWSGLPFPSPGDLPNPGIEPGCPISQADSLPTEPPGKPYPNYGYSLKQDGKAKANQQICLQRKALDYSLKPLQLQSSYQPLKGKRGTLLAH